MGHSQNMSLYETPSLRPSFRGAGIDVGVDAVSAKFKKKTGGAVYVALRIHRFLCRPGLARTF